MCVCDVMFSFYDDIFIEHYMMIQVYACIVFDDVVPIADADADVQPASDTLFI